MTVTATVTGIPRLASRLRVAIIAPPWFSVPPRAYGGTEAVCASLADGLIALGHEVVLVGAGDDLTGARFHATYRTPPSSRLGEPLPEVLHTAAAARLLAATPVDLVHDHTLAGPLLARGRPVPTVVTAHGAVAGEAGRYYRELGDTVQLVAISEAQRRSAPDLPWVATVHNGVDVERYPFLDEKSDYVVFMGRMSPEKGAHVAIDAARAAGRRIVLAGKCAEPLERAYFDAEIAPRLGPGVCFYGEAGGGAKNDLLARASCLVFPISWEEPFGLVMVEAMACGTPVVALRRGSVPEVVVDGVTGFICDDPTELPDAIVRADGLARAQCRSLVERSFAASRMVEGYEAAYRELLGERRRRFADKRHPGSHRPAGALATRRSVTSASDVVAVLGRDAHAAIRVHEKVTHDVAHANAPAISLVPIAEDVDDLERAPDSRDAAAGRLEQPGGGRDGRPPG